MRALSFFLISILAFFTLEARAQCVVINEIMINPTGTFDGNQNGPQTSEWIELYNACSTPVDMSCWVLGAEYYTVTIPSGTILPPGGFFTLGTSNSGFPVDLDIVACGCGSPYPTSLNNTNFGVLNNSHGYAVLTNSTGQIMDGLWWGPAAGAFPFSFTSSNSGTCGSITVNVPNASALTNSTSLYTSGSGINGGSWARPCDGVNGFTAIAAGSETPGTNNGALPPPTPVFSASPSNLCPGQCANFTSSNPTAGLTFSWNLPGGTPSFFSGPNPPPICYNNSGNYTVILVLSNSCGNSTLTVPNAITVSNPPPAAVVSPSGPLNLCSGGSLVLQVTSGPGPFQWFQNGVALPGQTANNLLVTGAGTYYVQNGPGACPSNSNQVVVSTQNLAAPTLSLSGPASICPGTTTTLNVATGTGTFQWMQGGVPMAGETGSSLTVNQAGTYSVVLTNNSCTAQSTGVSIATLTLPTPTILPGSTVICGSGPLAIQTNSGQGSYQWQLNGSDIAGATSSAYNATVAGTYTVVVTNASACSGTASITLTQLPFQNPTVSPSGNQSFCAGSSLTLNANATAGSTFQWTLNGTALPGANTSSFSATQAGTYAVTVALGSCSAASTNVQVTVNSTPNPVINQLGPLTICPGQSQVLSLNQSFSSYQWLLNGSPIAGQTLGSLAVSTSGTYGVVVTNWSGCTATATGPLVNVSTLTPPVISGAPVTLCNGQSSNLSAPPGLSSYQWYFNGSSVAGATTANLVVSQGGAYSVDVTDAFGCSLSSSNVSIQVINPNPGVWISGPTSFCNGGNVTLTSQNPNASYVWFESGVAVPGASASSLVVTQTGTYTVQVVVGGCSITSAPISVSVFGAVPPIITANPGLALCPGSTVTMSAGGTFSQLQWLLNGAPISGANNASLSVTSTGTYSVVGTQSYTWNTTTFNCIANSANALVSNGQVPVPVLSGPNPLVLCAATSAPITVTGTFATCQWLLNGAQVPGATSPTFNASTAGLYTVEAVSADGCTAVSNPLTVQGVPAVLVSLNNQGQSSFCQGGQTQLQATAGFVSYQWLQNGAPLVSNASNQLSVNASGSYSVVATDGNGCSGTSSQQNVTVWPLPSPTIASANGLFEVCPGDSILLQSPQTFSAYQWSQGAALSPGNVQQQWASTPGTISLVVTDANGCSATTNATVSAAPVPTPVVTAPANGLCAGQVLVLSTGVFSSYEWFLNSTTVSTGNATLIASEVGNYAVRVENAQGCADTSSVFQVFPSAIPPPAITTSNPQPCAGEPIVLTATSTDGSIAWSNGQSGGQLVVFASGAYTATVTAPNGCKSDSTYSVVYKPKPIITMGPDQTVFCDRAVEIDARAQGTYTWSPTTGLSNPEELNTQVIPEVTTRYVLTATLNGCTHSDSVLITVEACETLWIPNSFSPNDDGKNDAFQAIGNDIGTYSLEVYDRWGQRLFSSSDPELGWDGTINGEKAPSGVYVWRIEVYNTQGKRMRSPRGDVGTISLLR